MNVFIIRILDKLINFFSYWRFEYKAAMFIMRKLQSLSAYFMGREFDKRAGYTQKDLNNLLRRADELINKFQCPNCNGEGWTAERDPNATREDAEPIQVQCNCDYHR